MTTQLTRTQRNSALLLALFPVLLARGAQAQSQDAEYLVVFTATWSAQTHPIDLASASIPGSWGGDLLVSPQRTLLVRIPSAGIALPLGIPTDENLCRFGAYFQILELDPGAVRGLSSSAGIELVLGD